MTARRYRRRADLRGRMLANASRLKWQELAEKETKVKRKVKRQETAGGRVQMEYRLEGENLVVRLSGELDLVSAAAFKSLVDDLLDRRKIRNLFVNMERVSFLDSSFLGALLGRYRRMAQSGGRMGIIGPPGPLRPTLELSGVFQLMREYRSESDALPAAEA